MPALPNISRGAGIRRIFAISDRKNTILSNGYISGAGVGAVTTANREALKRRAVLIQELDASGNLVGRTCGCDRDMLLDWMTGTLTDDNIHRHVALYMSSPSHPIFTDTTSPGYVGHISNWETSLITNAEGLFANHPSFNEDIGQWNTGNITNMAHKFKNNTTFNKDISNWDVSKVITMESMFEGATNFNQTVKDWDTSSVTSMKNMFRNATSFNAGVVGTVDTAYQLFGDVTSVETMEGMFQGASSFNGGGAQTITNWQPQSCTNFSYMFDGATIMGSSNFGQLSQSLISWSNYFSFSPPPAVTHMFRDSAYRTGNFSNYTGGDTPNAGSTILWNNQWSSAPP